MSEHGHRHRPTNGGGPLREPMDLEHQAPGAGVEADREWARQRLANHLAANQVARKATEHDDADENGSSSARASIPEGSGQPLAAAARKKLEPRLGTSLGDVRVHTGGESATAARQLSARAFTVGNDVHFGAGQFAPDTKEGDRLLVHELTHVVQGQRSGIQRKEAGSDPARTDAEHDNGGGGAHAGHDVSQPGEPAENEADAVADKVTDELHEPGEKQGDDGGGQRELQAGHATSGHGASAEEGAPAQGRHGAGVAAGTGKAPAAAPKPISAKLESAVGRKIYRTPAMMLDRAPIAGGKKIYRASGKRSAGSASGSAAATTPRSTTGAGASSAAAPAATPALTAATAKAAIDSKARDVADLSAVYATEWVGKTQTDLDAATTDVNLLKHHVIEKFVSSGDERTQTQVVGRPDPIAIQKFQDIDNEGHLSDPSLKGKFYKALVGEMKKADFTDRSRTYSAMKNAAPPAVFAFKGNVIPANRISPLSARNHSVDKMFDNAKNVIATDIEKEIETAMAADGATPRQIAEEKAKEDTRRKAYRHLLKKGRDPLTTIDKSRNISEYGTWYAPGEIRPNPAAAANTEFARMMTLGALQPEWYPSGTVVLNIDRRLSEAAREVKKPTCFDGMMSALWTARNLSEDDYGVTGGGVGEFLEAKVPFSDVTSAKAIIPDDEFLADIQRVVSEVKNKQGDKSTPTEELVRGNKQNTRILNTTGNGTGGAKDMYGQITNRSTQEQNHPGPAPTAPGAGQPNSSVMPAGPARAPGGAYDMTSGPRAR